VRLHDPVPIPAKPKPVPILQGKPDKFGGLTVELTEPDIKKPPVKFKQLLAASLEAWKADGVRGLWMEVPNRGARHIPVALELGFDFHHAKAGSAMLTCWLPEGESRLPLYPHHQVGAAGMVLGKGNMVLVIREASGITAGLENFWKLPGGLVDPKEDIQAAAVREVLEETGIRTEFTCIAACRESHQAAFDSSDLYYICALRLSKEYGDALPEPKPQEKEIAEAKWMPLEEFLGSKWYTKGLYGSMLRTAAGTAQKVAAGESHEGLNAVKLPSLGRREETMYFAGMARL